MSSTGTGDRVTDEWAAFDASRLEDRVRAFNHMTADAFSLAEPVYRKPPDAARAERAQWSARLKAADANWITVCPSRGALRARVFEHRAPRAIYLHLHGGGWVLGAADQQDELLDDIRNLAAVTVISLEYRLAPEHPFPAAVDDAQDALRWILDCGLTLFRCERVVIGGESAGANLAAVALTRTRGTAGFERVRGACFNYGTFDLTGTPSLLQADARTPFLDGELSRWFASHYAPPGQHRHPEVSPLYADLAGMPPAQFLIGTADAIVDDTLFMHARWRAAGNPAELCALPGGLHGLLELRTPLTTPGRQRLADFIVRRCPL